ncbi:hypothetical protein FSP39_003147 [Pinctada imbricata]|uniref:Uncharacterized protein n=1 Tax=Pinctada imbricata TaxID=66713 RepID=A0AA89C8B9_PINIB|nr:hypothetical protein FSP39_003147 [Pinctada imbricata]
MDRRLYNLQQESEKLNKDVEVLEDALILHHRYKQQDESSVRGIIRKEIGGAIWQHGGTGKLRTYRSAKDLNENNDTASIKRSQRRQRSQATAVSKLLTTSAGKTHGNSGMARTPECQSDHAEVGNVSNLLNLGNVNIDKVAEMKTKVLEKASINVIKRKTDFKRDNTEKQGEEIKGKKGKEKIVKSDKNVNNNAESRSQKGNKTAVKAVDKTTVKEALERETNLLSDKNNRKEVKQTNRILVDFETEKLDPDDFIGKQKGLEKPVKISEVQRAITPHKSSHSSVPNSNTKSGVDVVLQQKDLLRKSLNCDPDVHLWLRQLGLLEEEKYVQMFAQNEIDMEVLVTLDEKHLEKMGVVALGAMKKLVRGIEELRSSAKKGKKDIIESIQPRKTEVRKSLHDAHTKSSELKRTLSDENRNIEVRKSQSEIQIKNANSDVRKSRNNAISSSDVDTVQKEKESKTSEGRSYHSTKTSSLSNDGMSVADKGSDSIRDTKQDEERKKMNSLSLKEKRDSQLKTNSVNVGSKDDCYGKFARSTSSKKPEKNVTSLKRSNSFHSQSNTKSETEPGKSGQQVQKPSSSKERTERKRDDSLTRVQGVRVRADSASSSGRSQGKGSNRPRSGQKPPKGKTVLTQKKAEEGVKSAAEKYEEKQKQEVEDEKRKVKDQERQKQYRDVMAARHQRRQTDRRKVTDIDSDSDDEIDDNSNPHLAQLIGVKITNNEKSGNPQNSSRSSAKSYARYSYSARKNTVKDIESQIASLQKKALAGEMVTMDLVKDLQKRLEEIESSIKQSDNTATKKQRAKYRKPVIKEDTSSEEEESDILKPLSDLDIQKVLSKSSKVKGLSMSMSKKELMKEIHKEKVAHRKEIRHLRAELNRTRSTDPGKAVEADQKDLDFQESDLIGEGAFSKVYHGVYQGTDVAVKQLKVPLSSHDRNYFAAEVSLLRDLRHPRVVLLMGVVTTNRFPLMILEYMARGSLYHLLHDQSRVVLLMGVVTTNRFPLMILEYMARGSLYHLLHDQSRDLLDHAEYYRYAHDIALGMNYLHQHKPTVLHLDLKSMNVLICSNDRAKIADFGFSKFRHDADVKAISSSKSKPVRAFPAWTAPELLETGEINPKADVYSFAIILWEMLTRKQPYEGCSVFQVLERTRLNKRPEIPENVPKELSDFIKQCWDPLPSRRPPFKEILHHLENMAFPPDWQALLKEAGVPPVALEDVQSTRTIISLVNNTLDTENVKTMVEEVRMSCDSHVTENMGLEYLYNQDHVELYTPRSPARVGKEKSTAMMKNSLTRDIEALGT